MCMIAKGGSALIIALACKMEGGEIWMVSKQRGEEEENSCHEMDSRKDSRDCASLDAVFETKCRQKVFSARKDAVGHTHTSLLGCRAMSMVLGTMLFSGLIALAR